VKREAIATLVIEHQLSERHACALVGLSRDAYRNPAWPSKLNTTLSTRIIEIAHTRRRAGYRMIHDLLRQEHPGSIKPRACTSLATACARAGD
jgi:putative transposase